MTDYALRLLARYSHGCRLAAEHGSHSGIVFEYACENDPQGIGRFGRWIDYAFLHCARATRLRRQLETNKQIVAGLITERRRCGLPTTILDVASGTGRVLREICREQGSVDLTVVCHDRDPRKVMQGRELVAREGLANVTFAVGDATDRASYLIVHEPDIVLATGLFPLLRRDDAVRTVINLAFEHMRELGQFVCTASRNRDPTASRWDGPLAAPIVDRAPETVAGWMRATGFAATRIHQPPIGDPVLIAQKPADG